MEIKLIDHIQTERVVDIYVEGDTFEYEGQMYMLHGVEGNHIALNALAEHHENTLAVAGRVVSASFRVNICSRIIEVLRKKIKDIDNMGYWQRLWYFMKGGKVGDRSVGNIFYTGEG